MIDVGSGLVPLRRILEIVARALCPGSILGMSSLPRVYVLRT